MCMSRRKKEDKEIKVTYFSHLQKIFLREHKGIVFMTVCVDHKTTVMYVIFQQPAMSFRLCHTSAMTFSYHTVIVPEWKAPLDAIKLLIIISKNINIERFGSLNYFKQSSYF